MATRKRRKRTKTCKYGKLKKPVRTKKGRKRRCKKSKRRIKRKKIKSKKFKMDTLEKEKLEDDRIGYTINYKNAHINLIVGKGEYNTDNQSIDYHLVLGHLYSRWDINKDAAPKGLTRKLLCELLLDLIKKNIIKDNSIILLEAEPSVEEKLLEMYKNMGFIIKEYIDKDKFDGFRSDKSIKLGRGAVMTSDVKSVILWCNDKFKL